MKKEKIAGMALIVVNVALIVAGIALYLGTDRKEPSFEFQALDIIYEEGMDTSRLLEGISAYDNKDGDITDKIVIEKLIENRELNSVVVIYGVSDEAGNVAKCSREFEAVFKEEPEGELSEGETQVQDGWLVQSGFWTELEGKDGAEGEPGGNGAVREGTVGNPDGDGLSGEDAAGNGTGENDTAGDGAGGNGITSNREAEDGAEENVEAGNRTAGNEAGAGDDAREQSDENRSREPAEETAKNGASGGNAQRAEEGNGEWQQERNAGSRNNHDPEAPVLTLKVAEVKTSVGVGPAWVELIGTLSDDKDGYETLFRNLEVSKYDKNQPGTYQVTVSTKDSDGKRSQPVPITIIVK